MKIIFADDSQISQNAWSFIRLGWVRAFDLAGFEVKLWDIHKEPAMDIFDRFHPDLFIGQTYNLERGIIKALNEYPCLKVLTGSDWSHYSDEIDSNKYPIVRCTSIEEVQKVEAVKPDLIICHYHQNSIYKTHEYWQDKLGIKIAGLPPAADVIDYTMGKYMEEFKSDVFFCGGRWEYKDKTIVPWFLPLCDNELKLNVKIFGNRNWGIPQFCGNLDTRWVKHAMASAKVCPNISELHAQDFGTELNERCFKLLSNKCPVVSDYTESLAKDVFNNGEIEFARTPKEFKEKILAVVNNDLTIDVQKGYDKVMESETYFHRVSELFQHLGLTKQSELTLSQYKKLREVNGL